MFAGVAAGSLVPIDVGMPPELHLPRALSLDFEVDL